MLASLKYILVALTLFSSWLVFLNYRVCPHHPTDAVSTFGCGLIEDHLNKQNLNVVVDNAVFNYQIYVQPRVTYFSRFVWPKYVALYHLYYSKAAFFVHTSVVPVVDYYYQLAKLKALDCATWLQIRFAKVYTEALIHLGVLHYRIITSSYFQTFTTTRVYFYLHHVYQLLHQLIQKTNFKRIQEKTRFMRTEFTNLLDVKFSQKSFFNSKQNLAAMIKNLLEDTNLSSDDDGADYEDETLTVVVTKTIQDAVATLSPLELDIKKFLEDFETKIERTIDLAFNNIETDIEPVINKTIESLQPQFTEIMQNVSKNNYEYYKDCHVMIQKIDKETSLMKEANELVEEKVSRQDMRDLISAIKAYDKQEFNKIENKINENFELVLNAYLRIIQDTIDILESFADSSFQDFSNKLTQILSESENESFNWNSWKEFHKLKTKVLDKRDFIFDQAKLIKQKQFDELEIESSFTNWLNFVKAIDYHMAFLARDNDEYLQLIRAKANVAYQLREATVAELQRAAEAEESTVSENSQASFVLSASSRSQPTVQQQQSKVPEHEIPRAVPIIEHVSLNAEVDVDKDLDDEEVDIEPDQDPDFSD